MPVRRATPADAATIESLIALYVPSGTLLPRSAAFIAEHAPDFLVATRDDEVVGCVHLEEYSPSLAEIRSLAVHPDYQGAGLGVELVAEAERLGRKRGYHTLFAVSNNDVFFRRHGYVERDVPELNLERSEVSRFKGVYSKDL